MSNASQRKSSRSEDTTQAGLQKRKLLSTPEPAALKLPVTASTFQGTPTWSVPSSHSDPAAPYGCARATPFLTIRLAKYWSPPPWSPASDLGFEEEGEQAKMLALDKTSIEKYERTKGQCINPAAFAQRPVDWNKLGKNSLQPLQLFQESFQDELKQRCCEQGLLGGMTGYDTAMAEAESAQADVRLWEDIYNSAEAGSFGQSLADVNLSKARGKLNKLEQQAKTQLQSILDIKETMLNELGLYKAHWKSESQKQQLQLT